MNVPLFILLHAQTARFFFGFAFAFDAQAGFRKNFQAFGVNGRAAALAFPIVAFRRGAQCGINFFESTLKGGDQAERFFPFIDIQIDFVAGHFRRFEQLGAQRGELIFNQRAFVLEL